MKNLNLEEDLRRNAEESLEPGFKLYDFLLVHGKHGLKIKVFLDNLNDPWGTPTIANCSKFARVFDSKLMDLVNMGRMTEDYVLEVSSPGAERELRDQADWFRFQNKPMKVRYNTTPEKIDTKILNLVKIEGEMTYWKKAGLKKDKKNHKQDKPGDEFKIMIHDINNVRLYLDF